MDVTADMVTVWFSSGAVVMDFADGGEVYGEWRKSGESLGTGTSMIAYDFAGYSTAYGTCGRTEAADGTRTLSPLRRLRRHYLPLHRSGMTLCGAEKR